MRISLFGLLTLVGQSIFSQPLKTIFEQYPNRTFTYQEGIGYCRQLDSAFREIKLLTYDTTDSGHPLHLLVVDKDGKFSPDRESKKAVILVMNAIHPGEPDGVDASLMLARNLVTDKKLGTLLDHAVICFIPFYNIGGALNRNSHSRANQNGPEEYGFRGNAQNYDLNRDLIKADTRNTFAFYRIFQYWQPDIFIDNHVTNGADYQYTLTLITGQPDKLGPLGGYMRETLSPALFEGMAKKKMEVCPYVNFDDLPDKGIMAFNDLPRYTTGYAALFNTFPFVVETHMLKPFQDRVWATYHFMVTMLEFVRANHAEIKSERTKAIAATQSMKGFDFAWKLDTTRQKMVPFKGYEHGYKPSTVTGQPRLYYDRKKPYSKQVPYFDFYKAEKKVDKPVAYIIPQGWYKVLERLRANGVIMQQLSRDTIVRLSPLFFESWETVKNPWEGHYFHYSTRLRKREQKIRLYQGDYIVYTGQPSDRYLMSVLEPETEDSFFAWNFFDIMLMQKEGFSGYVFEEIADSLLRINTDLKKEFDTKRATDTTFIKSPRAQLDFIYKRSEYHEPSYLRYPIFRLDSDLKLPLEQ